MSLHLKQFSGSEILVSQEQAWNILKFFFPGINTPPGSLTDEDRAFAQALLVEAIDASYNMGYVEILFKSFYMKTPKDFDGVKDLAKEFAKAALKRWFKHATKSDLQDPKIYESVKKTLVMNFAHTWKERETTGQLTY